MRARWRQTRTRLTLVYAGVFLPVAVVAATAFWLVFASLEFGSIDASLGAQAQVIISELEDGRGHVDVSGAGPLPSETRSGIAVDAVLFGPDGAVLDRSASVRDPQAYAAARQGALPPSPARHETRVLAGVAQRLLVEPVDLGGRTGVLVLARSVDELQETLLMVAVLLAAAVAALVMGAAGLGYWAAGRALSPVRVIAATARDISEQDLHRRIELDLPPGDELGELAATFNSMLDRLETAFDSLQRFTADAAHELRAPLALMRTQVDVTLRRDRSPEEYRASHRALLVEIERLSRMADQLLLLARADAGVLQLRPQAVELPELLESTAERWRLAALDRGVRLETELPLEGSIRADPDLLRRLLDNLLDNAVRHTPAGGSVRLSAGADAQGGAGGPGSPGRRPGGGSPPLEQGGAGRWPGGGSPPSGRDWLITVEDTGPGVAPELRQRLFERFARADAARGRETGAAGLGLSLCAAIAAAHGGTIHLDPVSDGVGARFLVRLPADARQRAR